MDEVYGPERADRLVQLLRQLAARIDALNDADLLNSGPELLRRIGDIRSELFHYEVRCTYDSPETADHRRIVEEARQGGDFLRTDESEDEEPWRDS